MVPRRKFVKGIFLGTVASTFLNRPWSGLFASEVALAASGNGMVKISIQDYPPLQQSLGSIRLGVNPVTPGPFSFPDGSFYPMLITRGPAGDFHCLDSQCQHAGCVVNAYSAAEGGLQCPCHGSLYAIDGRVLRGPTRFPLPAYEFKLEGNLLTIQVPNLGYDVAISRASSAAPRVGLQFHASLKVEYEVHFRERLTDAWSRVAFSRTANGAANEFVLTGADAPVTVYLDRTTPTGFYVAAMRLLDLT